MKIIDVPVPGGPEALVIAERPVPVPKADEVLIRVFAAGLNRADILQRRGNYPPPAGAPSYPGLEVSGTIESVGDQVTEFKRGDRVCALLQGGGYAQFAVAPAAQVLALPENIDLLQGAGLAETCFTVWSNVFMFGGLRSGETLLVHGGTSGIGVTAIQLAKSSGATVIATAGSDDKCRFCESIGASRAINYRSEDFVAAALQATQGRGVDVILDMVAGEYTARNIDALAAGGRLVIIATQAGATSTINILKIMQKRAVLTGSALRPRPTAFKAQVKQALLEHVWPRLRSGELRVIIDRTYAMQDAPLAHQRMESSEHIGKILLTMEG